MALVLGIESSCDETAVALVDTDRRIHAERIASQHAEHAPYGGVVIRKLTEVGQWIGVGDDVVEFVDQILVYFSTLLETTKLNEIESLELAKPVLQ